MLFLQALGDNPLELVPAIIEAAKGGQWSLFASMLIMLLVFLMTKVEFIAKALPDAAKPWVAAAAGVLAAVGATAATTGNWGQAIMSGLVTGAAASGLWELVGKKLLRK